MDKAGLPTSVLRIERISSDIKAMNIDGVRTLFKSPKAQDVDRPKEGEIDCLLGYEYAAFHPVRIQAIGHLLLLHNRFGTCRICYMKYEHSDRGRESFGAKKEQNKTSVINVN